MCRCPGGVQCHVRATVAARDFQIGSLPTLVSRQYQPVRWVMRGQVILGVGYAIGAAIRLLDHDPVGYLWLILGVSFVGVGAVGLHRLSRNGSPQSTGK